MIYFNVIKQDPNPCPIVGNILSQMDGNSKYDHPTWKEFDELSEADKKLVQKQIEHQLKRNCRSQTEKSCGNIPGELYEIIR